MSKRARARIQPTKLTAPSIYNAKTRNTQCLALSKLFDDKFNDVIFIIGESKAEIKANRALLSAHSPVFEAMLYGQMIESQLNATIPINDIDPDAFKSVLKYCYCNDPKLNEHNIVLIKQIADKYQIDGLSQLCDEQLLDSLNRDNFCKLLNESAASKLDKFIKICMSSILNNNIGKYTKQIIESSDFMNMSQNSMKLFVQSDDLLINEEKLWDALLKWSENKVEALENNSNYSRNTDNRRKRKLTKDINDNEGPRKKRRKLIDKEESNDEDYLKDERLKFLKELCPFIRFGLMTETYFVNKVKPLKCLTGNAMTEILSYQLVKSGDCGGFNMKERGQNFPFKFMNGLNILSRAWNKGDDIEYDSNPERLDPTGRHIHQGTLVNIMRKTERSDRIVIKNSDGAYISYSLDAINIKFYK